MNKIKVPGLSLLKAIYDAITSSINIKSNDYIKLLTVEITRPNDTTSYAAGDVISSSDSAPALPYVEIDTDVNSKLACIVAFVRIQTNTVTWANTRLKLHLFKGAITPQNDNAAYSMLYSNAQLRSGSADVSLESANGGTTDSVAGINNFDRLVLEPSANRIYLQLQTLDAKAPIASQKFLVQVGVIYKKL